VTHEEPFVPTDIDPTDPDLAATDLAARLRPLYQPSDATGDGLADAVRRGRRRRRHRRTAGGLAVCACAVAGALGITTIGSTGPTETVGITGRPTGATTPTPTRRVGGEPTTFVVALRDGKLAVASTASGRVLRVLTPVPAVAFGVMGVDRRVFYDDAQGATGHPGCGGEPCAVQLATGATRPVDVTAWRWTPEVPPAAAVSVSPDGRHGASISGTRLQLGARSATPRAIGVRGLDAGSYAWSTDSSRLVVATSAPGAPVAFRLLVVDVTTGRSRSVNAAAGCHWVGMPAVGLRAMFEPEQCASTQRIAVVDLRTGQRDASIALPAGVHDLLSLAVDRSGTSLIATAPRSSPDRSSTRSSSGRPSVWTETSGRWVGVPHLSGAFDAAW
jgi:hypothetical protein